VKLPNVGAHTLPGRGALPAMRASSRPSNAACLATNENAAATSTTSKVTMWIGWRT
jgi:hypothetical protein